MTSDEEHMNTINGEEEMSRKRKNQNHNDNFQVAATRFNTERDEDQEEDCLRLSLSYRPTRPCRLQQQQQQQSIPPPSSSSPPPSFLQSQQASSISFQALLSQQVLPAPLQLSSTHSICCMALPFSRSPNPPLPLPLPSPPQPPSIAYGHTNNHVRAPSSRRRRNPTQVPREGKSETIPVPFPWATNKRATVHTLAYLTSMQIHSIKGEVQCKRCEKQYEIEYNVREKFFEIGSFIVENRATMHDRAPSIWMIPNFPTCKFCDQENMVKPVISDKKKSINWLFLLLGQMLGVCTLEQLKYFCKHTKNHRTGAKDRVLYLTYLGLCKQLDPSGPFDR